MRQDRGLGGTGGDADLEGPLLRRADFRFGQTLKVRRQEDLPLSLYRIEWLLRELAAKCQSRPKSSLLRAAAIEKE